VRTNRTLQRVCAFALPLMAVRAVPAAQEPPRPELPDTNTVFKPAVYKTLEEWKARREWLREQVRVAAGLWPEPKRTPLHPKVFDKKEYDGYTIEKVCFESYPGFYVIGNLYRPARIEGRIPAVACALGHWAKGRLHQDDVAHHPALALTLARLGATVLVYDMTGYNDGGRQIKHGINTPQRDLWGITTLHLQTWNSTRVIDFLQSLPEVDPERIGMTGASGGGTQTFILYAIDDRVKVAVPVNMISSTMQGGCVCENAPCLRIDANNMDIGALMAPRPLLMISTSGDWTRLTPQVEYPFIRGIYELYGAADRIANAHFDYGHNYNRASREAMYPFMARWLLNKPELTKVDEGEVKKFEDAELTVWTDENVPRPLPTIEQLTEQLQKDIEAQARAAAPTDAASLAALRRRVTVGLNHIIAARWLPREQSRQWPESRSGNARRQLASRLLGRGHMTRALGPLAVVIAPELSASFEESAQNARTACAALTPVGKPASQPAKRPQFFTTFNRTDAAEAVVDALATLCAELQHGHPSATLRADGELGPVGLVARALVPDEAVKAVGLRTAIDMNGFDVTRDDDYLKHLNLPHIRRIGGLRAVAAAACNGPIWFHHVGENFDREWVEAAGRINGVEVKVTREKADEKAIADWLNAGR